MRYNITEDGEAVQVLTGAALGSVFSSCSPRTRSTAVRGHRRCM